MATYPLDSKISIPGMAFVKEKLCILHSYDLFVASNVFQESILQPLVLLEPRLEIDWSSTSFYTLIRLKLLPELHVFSSFIFSVSVSVPLASSLLSASYCCSLTSVHTVFLIVVYSFKGQWLGEFHQMRYFNKDTNLLIAIASVLNQVSVVHNE